MATDYDKEINILSDIQSVHKGECLILSDLEGSKSYNETAIIINSILESEIFSKKWIDNSGKNQLPPDFINKADALMMEVMRFDDRASKANDNLSKKKESSTYNEIRGIFPQFSDKRLIVNTITDLPTEDDHNYKMYFDGFKRTVNKHLSKLGKYRNNYPDFKTIFLVCDESSGTYFETIKGTLGKVHVFFLDKKFLDVFINSDLEYLIWYAPYKHFETVEHHNEFPRIIIFDIVAFKSSKEIRMFEYDENKMISNEL